MCQGHKILKKYTVTFHIIKNTLEIALCYVSSTLSVKRNLELFRVMPTKSYRIKMNDFWINVSYSPSSLPTSKNKEIERGKN